MKAFFDKVREKFGPLSQKQVEGFELVLKASEGLPLRWRAYILATAWHETARTMQPVREAYWLTESWRKANLRYYPWYGRGYVQLTWEANYIKAGRNLGLDLTTNPDKVMEPEISAKILVKGMTDGWFTNHKLGDQSYREMRRIVNGTDKADLIAGYAYNFEDALKLLATPAPEQPVEAPKSFITLLIELLTKVFSK